MQQLLEGGATANFKGSESKLPSALDLVCTVEDADIGRGEGPATDDDVQNNKIKKRKIAQVNNHLRCFCALLVLLCALLMTWRAHVYWVSMVS